MYFRICARLLFFVLIAAAPASAADQPNAWFRMHITVHTEGTTSRTSNTPGQDTGTRFINSENFTFTVDVAHTWTSPDLYNPEGTMFRFLFDVSDITTTIWETFILPERTQRNITRTSSAGTLQTSILSKGILTRIRTQ